MFTFNGVFGENAKPEEVFKPVGQLIESALIGYKATIFAFGQTGSGKTYTMSEGPDKKDELIQQTFEFLRKKLREDTNLNTRLAAQWSRFTNKN
jgi:kinesin family protein 6/9